MRGKQRSREERGGKLSPPQSLLFFINLHNLLFRLPRVPLSSEERRMTARGLEMEAWVPNLLPSVPPPPFSIAQYWAVSCWAWFPPISPTSHPFRTPTSLRASSPFGGVTISHSKGDTSFASRLIFLLPPFPLLPPVPLPTYSLGPRLPCPPPLGDNGLIQPALHNLP